jgi:hypothetical protein
MKHAFVSKLGCAVVFISLVTGAWAIEVSITPPQIDFTGTLATAFDATALNTQLTTRAAEIEADLDSNQELQKYGNLPKLGEGFANAGSATAQSGILRSAQDFKIFSVGFGSGMGIAVANLEDYTNGSAADKIEKDGDMYMGVGIQPVNVSAGLNLGFLVSGLRATAKFGYSDIAKGEVADDFAFNSLSVGAGVSYQLLKPKSIPLGLIRWRGLNVASGLFYQRNKAEMQVTPNENGYESTAITLGSVGFDNTDLAPFGLTDTDQLGTVNTKPVINATIEASTVTIPLAVTTGVRVLYIIDLSAGAGVDLVFGSTDITLKGHSDVNFEANPALATEITVTQQGSADATHTTGGDPQLLRPHVMMGAGFSFGPVTIEIPVSYYFDSKGNTYFVGINAGISF